MKKTRFFVWALALVIVPMSLSNQASAMIEHHFARTYMSNDYLANGVFTGGQASINSTSFSILGIRRIYAARQKIERVVIKLGDNRGRPLIDHVSYFHVSVNKALSRVEVDLSQTVASNVNQKKLKQLFLKSRYVKSAQINFDPTDLSMTIQLKLKSPVKTNVFELLHKGSAGKIVIDMKPLSNRVRKVRT